MENCKIIRIIMIIISIITFLGCTTQGEQSFESDPTQTAHSPINTEMATATSLPATSTPTVAPTIPLPTNTVQEPVFTKTPIPIENNEAAQVNVCSSIPLVYDFRSISNIQLMTVLSFLDDDTLLIEGWDTETEYISASFDLKTERVEFQNQLWSLLSDPCNSNCLVDIIAQSPNGKWQLLFVRGSSSNAYGIWLVSESNQTHLVNFIPVRSMWQWSNDGTLLSFEHNKVEFGIQTIIVQLEDEPIVHYIEASQDNPLNRTWYFVAFSPNDNTALAIQNPRQFESSSYEGQLHFFDLNQDISEQSSVESIPNLVKVEWNRSTESYLLIFSYEDGIELVDRETGLTVKLLLNTFDGLLSEVALQHNIPFSLHTLSISGTSLVITLGDGRIFVFECQVESNP